MIRTLALVLATLTPFLTTPAYSHQHHETSFTEELLDEEDHRRMHPAHPPAVVAAQPNSMALLCVVFSTLGALAAYELVKSWF